MTTSITSKSAGLTVPDGTSERNAIGRLIMNASSERRPDLARRAADRGAEGGEAGAAGGDRRDPEQEAAPVEVDEQPEAGEHQQGHHERDDDPQQDLLAEQRRFA